MIYLPEVYGMCKGAENALKSAYEIYNKEKRKKIYILKEILHNERIIKDLKNKGIETIESIDAVTKDDLLIIRAHGETKEIIQKIKEKGIEYFDATCPNVQRIHDIVEKKYIQGYTIILIGKKNHPETIGTCGWCNNEAIVIENKEDIEKIDFEKLNKVFVTSQTTISEQKFMELSENLKNRIKDCEVVNSVCNAQKLIQDSSCKLAKQMDVMIIIGGENSSNTDELYKKCKEITKSYKISDICKLDSIKLDKLNKNIKIGLTGGASTPKEQIMEYKKIIEDIY